MPEFLSNDQIDELIQEEKKLDEAIRSKLNYSAKKAHREASFTVQGADDNEFRVIVRQNQIQPLDFSVILGFQPETSNILRHLRRYNGKSHQHTNKLPEDEPHTDPFYDFHIHHATERYQLEGFKIEGYAEPTDDYFDLDSAIDCLVQDCNFVLPPRTQTEMLRDT